MRDKRPRSGAVLLETLVGVVMLAVAGIAWVTLAGQTARTLREVHDRELQLRAATATLERIVVRRGGDLAAMIGTGRVGAFDVRVAQIAPRLFDVVIADTLTGATLLHTSTYPDTSGTSNAR